MKLPGEKQAFRFKKNLPDVIPATTAVKKIGKLKAISNHLNKDSLQLHGIARNAVCARLSGSVYLHKNKLHFKNSYKYETLKK